MKKLIVFSLFVSSAFLIAFNITGNGHKQQEAYVPEKLSAPEMVKWMEDPANGFLKAGLSKGITYELLFRSPDYVVALESRGKSISPEQYETRKKENENFLCFKLRVSEKRNRSEVLAYNIQSEEEYHARNMYYSYEFQQDIKLINDIDTIPCGLYQFVNSYGTAPYVEMLFEFDIEKIKLHENITVLLRDRVFANEIKFDFDTDRFLHTPKLEL
ncbi:MAG: hypothetical protein ACOZCO_00985 [Bacteroidota bacterium]